MKTYMKNGETRTAKRPADAIKLEFDGWTEVTDVETAGRHGVPADAEHGKQTDPKAFGSGKKPTEDANAGKPADSGSGDAQPPKPTPARPVPTDPSK